MTRELGRKWDQFQPSKTQAFWFAVACVLATLVLGFGYAGWVGGGTAAQLQAEAADTARHELASAICVDEFLAAKDAKARLATLRDAGWYERTELVEAGGWATMPDRKEPNRTVSIMCSAQLAEHPL